MLMGRSAASKLRRKSQREAAELREQSDATLAMEEEELAREEEDEIVFKRRKTVPDTPRASRANTPDPDDGEEDHRQFATEGELSDDPLHCEDPVMHISGAGHWFLEGWIGDHSVEFLVDSGSSVTAMSDVLYGNWGARAARCRFWDCERSSPLSSAAWRREWTRSLGRMC